MNKYIYMGIFPLTFKIIIPVICKTYNKGVLRMNVNHYVRLVPGLTFRYKMIRTVSRKPLIQRVIHTLHSAVLTITNRYCHRYHHINSGALRCKPLIKSIYPVRSRYVQVIILPQSGNNIVDHPDSLAVYVVPVSQYILTT